MYKWEQFEQNELKGRLKGITQSVNSFKRLLQTKGLQTDDERATESADGDNDSIEVGNKKDKKKIDCRRTG